MTLLYNFIESLGILKDDFYFDLGILVGMLVVLPIIAGFMIFIKYRTNRT
jgi:hypothetical protein